MPSQLNGSPAVGSGEPAVISPNRGDDQLLFLPEVAGLMRAPETTLRWLRHPRQDPLPLEAGAPRRCLEGRRHRAPRS